MVASHSSQTTCLHPRPNPPSTRLEKRHGDTTGIVQSPPSSIFRQQHKKTRQPKNTFNASSDSFYSPHPSHQHTFPAQTSSKTIIQHDHDHHGRRTPSAALCGDCYYQRQERVKSRSVLLYPVGRPRVPRVCESKTGQCRRGRILFICCWFGLCSYVFCFVLFVF